MEKAQREIINGVRYDLLRNMRCDTMLLAKLMQEGLLTDFEVEIESKNTNADKCIYLLEILLTKQNGFLKLYEALVELKQSGASISIFNATEHKIPGDYAQMMKINERHQFSTDEIYFQQSPPDTNKLVLSKDINILIITTINSELTTKKIRDTLSNVCVKTKTFVRKSSGMITVWTQANEISKLVEQVSKRYDKHIIVTNQSLEMITEQIKTLNTEKLLITMDTFGWDDLTENFQTKMLLHKVQHLNELEDWLTKYGIEADDSLESFDQQFLTQLINNKAPSIFRNTIPLKPKYYVTRTIESRFILSLHKIVDDENQEDKVEDIFLVSGLEQMKMTSYFKKMTNTASSQIRQNGITVQFIRLESESEFALICSLTTSPVHWIHHLDKRRHRFIWIKSRGDITSIQKLVTTNNQDPIPENEFSTKVFCSSYITDFRGPVCIVDSPGMGKTELLANIGRSLQKTYPDQLTVYIRAPDFTSKVKEKLKLRSKVTTEILSKCICTIICSSGLLTNAIFQSWLKTNLKINLLLDGYDEISYTDIKLAEEILKLLSKNETNIRIFVSSRPQNLESLEKAMSVLAYKILPFSRDEQHKFLVLYWTQVFTNMSTSFDPIRLDQFTSLCLKSVDEQIPKTDREFAGIPLQCLLIGIAFQNSALLNANSGNRFSEGTSNIGVQSVSDLFNKCIQVKFQDAVERHQIEDFDVNECMYAHACHAIKLIFPDFPVQPPTLPRDLYKFGILEQTLEPGENQQFLHRTFAEYLVSWVATAQLRNQKHKFIDINNAKLLLALLFETTGSLTDSYKQLTFDFVNWMCLHFVNQMCGDLRDCKNLNAEIKGITFDHCIRQMALACARRDFEHILNLFFKTQHKHLRQLQFIESLLFASVSFANLPVFQLVCNYFETIMSTSKPKYELRHVTMDTSNTSDYIGLFDVAVAEGKFDVVEYLSKEKGFTTNKSLYGIWGSLASEIIRHDDSKVEQKLNILEYLCIIKSKVEREELYRPIFSYESHPRIVRHFFNLMQQYSCFVSPVLRVCVLLPDEDMNSSLLAVHKSGYFYKELTSLNQPNPKEWHIPALKEFILDLLYLKVKLPEKLLNTASTFMDLNTLFDMTTKQSSLAYEALSETTNVDYMKLLQAHGVNFKICHKRQNLMHIFPLQGSVQFVCFLIEAGVSVNSQDENGNTPLHILLQHEPCRELIIVPVIEEMLLEEGNGKDCWVNLLEVAINHANVRAAAILLEKASNKIENYCGPLYHAMIDWKHDTAKQTEIVEILLKYGADITTLIENVDFNLQDKINCGECTISFQIMERLIFHEFQFSSVAATKTLIFSIGDLAINESQYTNRLFRYLVKLGADLNVVEAQGNTLLHKATKNGQLDYVRILIDSGLSPNCLNSLKQTPLHLEIKDGSKQLPILEYLVDKGANLCAKTAKNNIALFLQYTFGKHNMTVPFVELLLSAIPMLDVSAFRDSEYNTIGELISTAVNLGIDLSKYCVGTKIPLLLHQCISLQFDMECVETLLTTNLPINFQDQDGNTPLHIAFMYQSTNLQLIKSLIKAGADLNIRNKLGFTPVESFTFMYDSRSHTKTLTFFGIDLKDVPSNIVQSCRDRIKHNNSSSGLHFLSTMATEGINVLACVEPNYIFECVEKNALALLRFVHSLGWDLATRDSRGNTILHRCLNGFLRSPELFHYVLDYAVATGNGGILTIQNNEGKTPLTAAVERMDVLECSLAIFNKLKVDLNFEGNNQIPLIVTAIKHTKSLAFIKSLQNCGCLLGPLIDGKWRHLGNQLAKDGKLVALQVLLDNGYNVNTRDENLNTLLHSAILGNSYALCDAVELFLKYFADTNAKNNEGLTPFEMVSTLTAQHFANEQCSEERTDSTQFNLATSIKCIRDANVEHLQSVQGLKLESTVFERTHCGGCQTHPIRNRLYKCLLCERFDLCHDCFSRDIHSDHIVAVVRSKNQNIALQKYYNIKVTAGWRYFYDEVPKAISKTPWKMTCSCCKINDLVKTLLYMCLKCSYNQCQNCWISCENTHLMVVVFTKQQCDTFSKVFRQTK